MYLTNGVIQISDYIIENENKSFPDTVKEHFQNTYKTGKTVNDEQIITYEELMRPYTAYIKEAPVIPTVANIIPSSGISFNVPNPEDNTQEIQLPEDTTKVCKVANKRTKK